MYTVHTRQTRCGVRGRPVRAFICSSTRRNPIFGALPVVDGLSLIVRGCQWPGGGVAGTTAVLGERETVRTAIAAARSARHWAASGNGTRQQPADWPRPATAGTHAHEPLRFLPVRALPTTPPPQSVRVNKGPELTPLSLQNLYVTR